jgi:hypothetical protein
MYWTQLQKSNNEGGLMQFRTRLYRWFTALIGGIFLSLNLAMPTAHAGMIGTDTVVQQEQLDIQRSELKEFLARDDIRDQLIAWGVNPADAASRVDSLNAQEVQTMSQRMRELPAGGDVLGAVVFVFLVLLVTDILGYTDIFPFVQGAGD